MNKIQIVVLFLTEVSIVSDLAFQNIMYMDMEPVMNPTTTMVRTASSFFLLSRTLFLHFRQRAHTVYRSESLTVIIKLLEAAEIHRKWFGNLTTEKSFESFLKQKWHIFLRLASQLSECLHCKFNQQMKSLINKQVWKWKYLSVTSLRIGVEVWIVLSLCLT